MFDISYMNLLQVKGLRSVLVDKLNKLTQSCSKRTFDLRTPGKEETVQLYSRAGNTIGEVQYFWFKAGVYKVPYSLSLGREYHGFGEEYNVVKKGKEKYYYLPYNIKAVGRISSGEEGKEKRRRKFWGRI